MLLLDVTLESDTLFGTGSDLPGEVDAEVDHDPRTGLPRINGRFWSKACSSRVRPN